MKVAYRFIRFVVLVLAVLTVPQSTFAEQCTSDDMCSAYALTDVATSLNTQGYYAQSQLLKQVQFNILGNTESTTDGKGIRLLAPIMYILSIAGAIFMMGFGQPPKLWIWFLVGPGVFHFLVGTTVPKEGVKWILGTDAAKQKRIWQLSQVGIQNIPGVTATTVNKDAPPSQPAEVSQLFSLYDDMVSHFVLTLVKWVGTFNQTKGNLKLAVPKDGVDDSAWFILSNSKWPMLEGITGSLVHNSMLREALVTFMASECGDIVRENLDTGNYAQAARGDAKKLPDTIFTDSDALKDQLNNKVLGVEQVYRELLKVKDPDCPDGTSGGAPSSEFYCFNSVTKADKFATETFYMSCMDMLSVIVHGFRFETGHVFHNTMAEAGTDLISSGTNYPSTFKLIASNFLYGWDFGDLTADLSADDQQLFIKNLIFYHLLRNELSMSMPVNTPRQAAASRLVDYGEQNQRTIGSKQKFTELYQWAKLIPYMQGLLLYFLCFSYPIVCMLMVVPGWWKTMITWASFYAWAKSWDVGFAIVMSLERTIWAMLGNNATARALNEYFINGGSSTATGSSSSTDAGKIDAVCGGIFASGSATSACDGVVVTEKANIRPDGIINIFDQGLILANALDLDLRNSYYIYLMSALYFAVPAVTGQIILGAKAGAAGLVTNAFQQSAQEFGGKAGSGALDYDVTRRMNAKESGVQEATAKGHRNSGLAASALATQSEGYMQGIRGQQAGAKQNLLGTKGQLVGFQERMAGSVIEMESMVDTIGLGTTQGVAKMIAQGKKMMAAASTPASSAPASTQTAPGTTGNPNQPPAPNTNNPKKVGPGVDTGFLQNLFGDASVGGMSDLLGNIVTQSLINYPSALAKDSVMRTAQGQQSQIAAQTSGLQLTGFHAQAEGSRLQQLSGRQEAAGQHAASESAWRQQRDFGESMSGRLGAMGMSPGAMSAGARSTDYRGLASAGRLGAGAAADYNMFNTGGEAHRQNSASTMGLQNYGVSQGIFTSMNNQESSNFVGGMYGLSPGATPGTFVSNPMAELQTGIKFDGKLTSPFMQSANLASTMDYSTLDPTKGLREDVRDTEDNLVKGHGDRKPLPPRTTP
jgi:hypothetical protein